MTCREKLALEHPEHISKYCYGGCFSCPHRHGYLDKPKWCGKNDIVCRICWDREIPEKKGENVMNKPTQLELPCGIEYGRQHAQFDLQRMVYKMCVEKAVDELLETIEKFEKEITTTNELQELTIKNVIFNPPATIVFWSDGTKTVVKADGEVFDHEKGLAMAIAKKHFGNTGSYFDIFKKWIPKETKTDEEYNNLVMAHNAVKDLMSKAEELVFVNKNDEVKKCEE